MLPGEGDDGFTLVDTGLAGSAASIVKVAQQLGARVRRIVLTHAHLDHVGSLDSLVSQLPEISLAVGQRESRLLVRDFSLDAGEAGNKLIGYPSVKSHPTLFRSPYSSNCDFIFQLFVPHNPRF